MFRIFYKISFFVIVGVGLALALNWVGETLAPVHMQHKARMQQLLDRASEIEALAVGHSHNLAIDFDALGLNGFHLWIVGSDMFETRYLLNSIIPLLPNLKTVFIPVTPYTFLHDNSFHPKGVIIRHVYYATTPTYRSFLPVRNDFRNWVMGKLCGIARHDHWQGVVESTFDRSFHGGNGPHQPSEARISKNGKIGPSFENSMAGCAKTKRFDELQQYIRLSKKVYEEHPGLPETVYAALTDIAQMLGENGIRPVFYSAPVVHDFRAYLQREEGTVLELGKTYMERLEREFDIQYYDFFSDTLFANQPEYFHDEDHLNTLGANVFSHQFGKILKTSTPKPRPD